MEKVKSFIKDREQNKEIIMYIIFGVLTTVINYIVYWFCAHTIGINEQLSNSIAWIIAVLFAFFTNKAYVFHDERKGAKAYIKAMFLFFSARFLSFVIFDIAMFTLLFNVLHINDLISKLIDNIFVIVFNYVASKWVIFNKNEGA